MAGKLRLFYCWCLSGLMFVACVLTIVLAVSIIQVCAFVCLDWLEFVV